MANQVLKQLSEKRKLWVKTTKENNFDKGISNLLTELYPHNAHFIYELLQNTEDAEATEISFELGKESLQVRHNGRSFTFADVEGITSIGGGTKANDINKIGKFGVGFKAVFSYTKTPIVYSDDYNFEIQELVVPVEIENKNENSEETVMIFPFNNPNKSQEKSYSEIKKGLKKLDGISLLFLNNLKTISYSYGDKSYKINREETDDTQINIVNSRKNKSTKWLRFKKNLPGSDKLFVSIAFNLGHNEKKKKETIQPVDGQVFIFFPAEKESSSLNFHIHAPFASTVARDSIKDIDENDELRDLISDLTIESLEYFKNNDLLDFDFLRTLPIVEDNLSDFYLPIQKGLIDCFNNNEYILTDNNSFKCGIDCYRSSKKIKTVIDIDVLRFLEEIEDEEEVYWIKNPSQLNSREDKFLQSLNINDFSNKELIEVFNKIYWTNVNISISELEIFLNRKSNTWIKQLYELLFYIYNIIDEYNYKIKYFNKIIKLQNGKFNSDGNKCFFDSSSNLLSSDFNIVHSDVYETNAKANNQKSKKFLEELGVTDISLKDEIKLILNGYNSNVSSQHSEHLNHLELFLKYFEETNNYSIFHGYPIILNNKNKLVEANKILIDSPWNETGLQLIDGSEHRRLLNDCYKKIQKKELFVDFLIAVEANFTIPIEKRDIQKNHPNWDNLIDSGTQSKNTIDEDFFIHKQKRLMNRDFNFSLLVWNSLSKHIFSDRYNDSNIFTARYRRLFATPTNKAPSTLFIALEENTWIPDKNLNFYKPQDISQEMLHDDFIYNDSNEWLTKIGFGKNILENNKEYIEKEKFANDISGLNLNTLKKLKEKGYTDEKILKFIEQEEAKEFEKERNPDLAGAIKKHNKQINKNIENPNPEIVLDEEEYRQKAQKKLESNLKKSRNNSKRYLSTQKVKVGKTETKEFLKKQYKGYCQICGFTFDQANNKGKYFEVFDWLSEKISKQKTNIIEAGSSLCLCSRCHSAIKYGDFDAQKINEIDGLGDLSALNFTEFADLIDSEVETENIPEVYSFIEMDMFKMSVQLLNKKQNIFYTEEHFLQFYNMLTLNQDKNNIDSVTNAVNKNISNTDLTEQKGTELELIENDSDKKIIESSEEKREEIKANSKVHIKYEGDKHVLKIQISRPRIGNTKNIEGYQKINKKSPLGLALIGRIVGETVNVNGIGKTIEILDVINK